MIRQTCHATRRSLARIGCAAATLALVAACAKSPESIMPISMAGAFDGTTCAAARALLATEAQSLATLNERQRGAVAGDAIGVLLIGVPMGSLTGNNVEGQIAATRGKVIALQARLTAC